MRFLKSYVLLLKITPMENYHFEDEQDAHFHDYSSIDQLHERLPDLPTTSPRVEYNDHLTNLSTILTLIFIVSLLISRC